MVTVVFASLYKHLIIYFVSLSLDEWAKLFTYISNRWCFFSLLQWKYSSIFFIVAGISVCRSKFSVSLSQTKLPCTNGVTSALGRDENVYVFSGGLPFYLPLFPAPCRCLPPGGASWSSCSCCLKFHPQSLLGWVLESDWSECVYFFSISFPCELWQLVRRCMCNTRYVDLWFSNRHTRNIPSSAAGNGIFQKRATLKVSR